MSDQLHPVFQELQKSFDQMERSVEKYRAEVADPTIELMEENQKLRAAIERAGFGILETSGEWSIHDVSEKGKAEEARSLEVATRSVELEVENDRLRKRIGELEGALKPFATIASVPGITPDDSCQLLAYEYAPDTATVGDCRRAVEVLQRSGS